MKSGQFAEFLRAAVAPDGDEADDAAVKLELAPVVVLHLLQIVRIVFPRRSQRGQIS